MTVNNKTAEIRVGQEVPYTKDSRVSDNSAVIKTNEYRKVGVTLKVTPRITDSTDVLLDVEEEISGLLGVDPRLDAPIFFTREAKATVIVRSGHTVVIGGLIRQENKETRKKVPILGDLPLIKHAFRYTEKGVEKTELIAFLTPIIIGDDGKAQRLTDVMWDDFKDKIKTKSFKKDVEKLYSRVTKATMLDDPDFDNKYKQFQKEGDKYKYKPSNGSSNDGQSSDGKKSSTYVELLDPPMAPVGTINGGSSSVSNYSQNSNSNPASPYDKPVVIVGSEKNSLAERARELFDNYNKGVVNE